MPSFAVNDGRSITVIVAVYNGVAYLERAVRSALEQTLSALEILVVDDGSTDGTAIAVQKLARQDDRVQLIRLDSNSGPSRARNLALDRARGQWIAILDADDICFPNRFASQVSFLQSAGIDLCGSWLVEFGQGLRRVARWPHTEAALRASMLFQNSICHPTVMARREVFDRYRYREDYRLAEDYDLYARVMADFKIANVPEVLLRYRRHPSQATQAKRDAMEEVTKKIRMEVLTSQGISFTGEEERLHNLIRAPRSIVSETDLSGVEGWLLKLVGLHDDPCAKKAIASQWVRACVRAAPLGKHMLRAYLASRLRKIAGASARTVVDLSALATMKLDYRSAPFAALRRLGLSA